MGICKCSNPEIINPKPPCSTNCVRIQHSVVKSTSENPTASVYPCNEALTIDVYDLISFDINQEQDIAEFEIMSYSDNLKDVVISSNAANTAVEISLKSNYQGLPAEDYKFGKITWKVQQGILSDIATITVVFRSKCATKLIPSGSICNPCDGTISQIIDVSINDSSPDVIDVSIN